jgi:hypothetical protein
MNFLNKSLGQKGLLRLRATSKRPNGEESLLISLIAGKTFGFSRESAAVGAGVSGEQRMIYQPIRECDGERSIGAIAGALAKAQIELANQMSAP